MGRPERPLDPEGGPVAEFASGLRRLRYEAGRPSYRELARRASFSVTVLSEAAGGRSLPTLAVVRGYVQACGGNVGDWEERWRHVSAQRPEPSARPAPSHRPGSAPEDPVVAGADVEPGAFARAADPDTRADIQEHRQPSPAVRAGREGEPLDGRVAAVPSRWLLSALVVLVAAAVAAGAAVWPHQTGVTAARAAGPRCPNATICVFSGAAATGTEREFRTSAYHSAWINFDRAAGFHPRSIIDNSGSDIWVYDARTATVAAGGPHCELGRGSHPGTFAGYQPGWFFIQYNVDTCGIRPPVPTGQH